MSKKDNFTNYTGSETTYKMVSDQIKERYGEKAFADFNPKTNCRTYKCWLEQGYRVRRGERALRSITYVKVENEAGEVVKCYPRTVNLFYYLQVEKI